MDYINTSLRKPVVLGDINFWHNVPTKSNTKKMLTLLNDYSFSQSVTDPTHDKGNTLDWVIYREDDCILNSTFVSRVLSSDHYAVCLTLDINIPSSAAEFKDV